MQTAIKPIDKTPAISQSIEGLFIAHQQGAAHLSELVNRFLSDHGATPQTLESYRRNFERFFLWYGDNQQPITRQLIKSYRRYLESVLITPDNEHRAGEKIENTPFNRFISPYTANNYISTIKIFVAWLNAESGIPNFAKQIKGFLKGRSSNHAKDALTRSQTIELFDTPDNVRDSVIIRLATICALRTVEIIRANVNDLRNREGEHVLMVQGKGETSKNTPAVIPPDTYRLLMQYLSNRKNLKQTDPLFTAKSNRNTGGRMTTRSVSRIIKNAMKSAQLNSPRLTAHSLRHTGITLAVEAGATLIEAQELARHKNPATTQIYFHNRNRIKNAMEKRLESFLSE